METICPTSLVPDSSWFIGQGKSTKWTKEENKKFESALAVFDEKTPNRWFKVAAMIPGKSVFDVINQYRELVADVSDIEAGLVPVPGKKGRTCDQERKKGVPWTEDEHRRFLLGLQKYGKGDWRSISRHFVVSKTPTQVASHAQKYYLRQLSGGKTRKGQASMTSRQSTSSTPLLHQTTIDLIFLRINELTFQQKLDEALTVF
ncbi:Transcription factor DIVARICATA [Sesamum angolense]|uniref:Transcription factor DIVARICATA n=1 Tax=Sesamum angolense TaxID=2727404 RepID=A0AAE2BZD6_9LAMI|nr:Transcription factor DIVARICATA [Sesamum angolense]